jgi:hypothetical protein
VPAGAWRDGETEKIRIISTPHERRREGAADGAQD